MLYIISKLSGTKKYINHDEENYTFEAKRHKVYTTESILKRKKKICRGARCLGFYFLFHPVRAQCHFNVHKTSSQRFGRRDDVVCVQGGDGSKDEAIFQLNHAIKMFAFK